MANTDGQIGRRIKEIRIANKLSQHDFAKIWGLSREAISQIESGSRRVVAAEVARLAEVMQISADIILGIRQAPNVVVKIRRERRHMEKNEMRISVPQKNIEKFVEVLLYILSKVSSKPNVGETVIYKLLYFVDFDYYEKFEEQLTGASYLKNTYGPTPLEFRDLVDSMINSEEVEKISSSYFGHNQVKYLPRRAADLRRLKANELQVIDQVIAKLSDMNATQISDYSHNDIPWLVTEENRIIDYESVFYRTPPYSVREYTEEDD